MPVALLVLLMAALLDCASAPSEEEIHAQVVARARRGGGEVDYQALRFLTARLPGHDPFLHERAEYGQRREDLQEAGESSVEAVREACRRLLDFSWVNVEAHVTCAQAYQRAGALEPAARHARIARDLLDSITRDADGMSFRSAYHVISVLEEQAVLRSKKLTLVDRRLAVEQQEPFDILTVEDRAGLRLELYFQIRPIMVGLYRAHVPDRGFGFNQLARGGPAGLAAWLLLAAAAAGLTLWLPGPAVRVYQGVERTLFARRWPRLALAAAAVLIFFSLRNEFMNLDAYTFAPRFARDVTLLGAHVTHDQMWEFYIHSRLWAVANAWLGWSVKLTYQVLSSLAGGAFILLLLVYAATVAPARPLAFFLFAISAGYVQLFFGDVENYTLTAVVILAYLLVSARFLRGDRIPLALPSAVLALAVTFHLLAGFLLPSLGYLWILAWRGRGWRPLVPAATAFLGIVGGTLAFFHIRGLPLDALLHSSHLMGYGRGFATMLARPSVVYYWDHVNLITLLAPGVVLLPPLLLLRRLRLDGVGSHLLLGAAGMLLFQAIWQAKLGVYYDWNLFANVALVASLWIGACLLHRPLGRAARAGLVAFLVLCAAQTGQWIVANHHALPPYAEGVAPD